MSMYPFNLCDIIKELVIRSTHKYLGPLDESVTNVIIINNQIFIVFFKKNK